MTKWAHLVSMSSQSKWAPLLAQLEEMGAGPDPSDPKAKTRARLLAVATDLFSKVGYRRTSMDEVARESGVAKGTVYLYFKNKQELLLHAIADEKKRNMAGWLPLLKDELEPRDRLRRVLAKVLLDAPQFPLTAKLITGDREILLFLAEMGPEMATLMEQSSRASMTLLLEGVGSFDTLDAKEKDARVQALMGLLFSAWFLMDERLRKGTTAEAYANQIAKMLVDGIGAP